MQKNIAILTMSLNIGGAETHIYELACALKQKGHNVTVFSAGGVYVEKLESRGINHIYAPLSDKKPLNILKSCKILTEYVKNNRPCIIHSHTRISNFTAEIVSRIMNVPFVSTIHGIYKTDFATRIFTKWGTRALAVSEDRKEYAVNCYNFDPDKVRLTVNGINLDTFKKNRNGEFKKSLGLSGRVILCVTRLDPDGCEHVYKLLEVAEGIYKNCPDTNIVIVGGGKKADDLKALADGINTKTKADFIRFEGPQTDIYRYCNIADLFVGISRSALEAMACEVPTLLLGNTGYIGLFSESTRAACIDTNFTCRGLPYPKNEQLLELITDMLNNPANYDKNVAAALDIVKTTYSVHAMADDAIMSYNEAERDVYPYDVMLCGYYGRRNLGDDMSLCALSNNLARVCGVKKKIILTTDAKATPIDNNTVCIHRFNLLKIFRYMKKTRMFILGSGSILQDSTSSRSMFYYLYILSKAIKKCQRTMLYSNGVGPITRARYKERTCELLNRVMRTVVRDRQSYDFLTSIGVDESRIALAADETFTFDKSAVEKSYPLEASKKYLGINLKYYNTSDEFLSQFAEFIDTVAKNYKLTPILLPVHYGQDMPALKRLSAKLSCQHILISGKLEHEKTLSILSQCEVSVLERLHSMIFSSIFEKPFIAIDYDPKVKSLCKELGCDDLIIPLDQFEKQSAVNKFDMLWQNRDEITRKLSEVVEQKRVMAAVNVQTADYLLN